MKDFLLWQKSSYSKDLPFSATKLNIMGPSLQSRNTLLSSAACCTHCALYSTVECTQWSWISRLGRYLVCQGLLHKQCYDFLPCQVQSLPRTSLCTSFSIALLLLVMHPPPIVHQQCCLWHHIFL